MTTRRFSAKAAAPRRWLMVFALAMVLGAQWLSLTHAITHATSACRERASDARCEARLAAPDHASWIGAVLGATAHHDDSSPLCRLLDNLHHAASVPSVPEIAAPKSLYALPDVTRVGRWVGLAAGHYSARAPPALS